MSLFGFIADVALAPVRVATVVASRSVRAVGKAVALDVDGVVNEVKKAGSESAEAIEKIADEADGK